MSPLQVLQQRFDRVAQRYGQVIGSPPLKSCDVVQLQADIKTMINALNSRNDPLAGPPTQLGAIEVSIRQDQHDTAQALVTAEVLDAQGRRAGMRVIPLNAINLDATVQTLIDAAAEIGGLPKKDDGH